MEYYEILERGRHFAGFTEGELDRHGNSMNYENFKKEFEACVMYWEKEMMVKDARKIFSYRIYFNPTVKLPRK